ncbi:hypothetical protein GRI40_10140 [Altererythrobacter aerius]|uniref:Uncharacterized protein n=1 Tax=Tsuneonella aeria TaxID=1837929 RepID=A0A6I4THN0_9SPHN|nr:hypothetical protein [Tsuneonella aeria]MXO75575.1 hypothetical protein [Tsuneonella aeria]
MPIDYRPALALPIALLLAACSGADREPAPGAMTTGEAKALAEAAEMLEQQRHGDSAARETLPDAAPSATPGPRAT